MLSSLVKWVVGTILWGAGSMEGPARCVPFFLALSDLFLTEEALLPQLHCRWILPWEASLQGDTSDFGACWLRG